MVVRIRITRGPQGLGVLSTIGSFLTLASVACFVLGIWKLSADLGWLGSFFPGVGVLSHWQVWMAAGVFAQLLAFRLSRRRAPGL